VQECAQTFHDTKDTHTQLEPEPEQEDESSDTDPPLHTKRKVDCHVPDYLGKLGVCEGKRPKSKVTRGVGDTTKTEFDGVNDLMYRHFTQLEL
jgi:hypothetical protein